MVYLAYPFVALNWLQRPFMGAFINHHMVFNNAGPLSGEDWPLHTAGVHYPDQLVAVDGLPVNNDADVTAALASYQVGDSVDVTVKHYSGAPNQLEHSGTETVTITLRGFPLSDLIAYFTIYYLIGISFLIAAFWVLRIRPDGDASRAFILLCVGVALVLGGVFDLQTTHVFTRLTTLAMALPGTMLFALTIVFPQSPGWLVSRPGLKWLVAIPYVIVAGFAFNALSNPSPGYYTVGWQYSGWFGAVGAVVFVVSSLYRWLRGSSPVLREQSRIVVVASILSLSLLIAWVSSNWATPSQFTPQLLLTGIIFPLAMAYALTRYRLLDADVIVQQTISYAILSVVATISYTLLLVGISHVLNRLLPPNNPVILALLVFLLVVGLNPLRRITQRLIDRVFFRGRQLHRERLQTFSRQLTEIADLADIAHSITDLIDQSLQPQRAYIFLRNPDQNNFRAYNTNGRMATDIEFAHDSQLATLLSQQHGALYLESGQVVPQNLREDRGSLAVLGANVFVPLGSKTRLLGWLALNPRKSGQGYTYNDLVFLESLADQSSLAIERAQVVDDLARSITEMNVINQITQATNFAITFDDLLELIFTQINRILPTKDFHIALYDKASDTMSYVFYLRNDERARSRENVPWKLGLGLSSSVLRRGQPLMTNTYEHTCAEHDVTPRTPPPQAWMGVPLNAETGTLGVMSMPTYTPGARYTGAQLRAFSAISNHAATAIAKSRLYQQTARRARQLATLNEVSKALTSTLELDLLLNRILSSAVNLLDCEAGSLFMTDQDTGEHVFEITIGPVDVSHLIGTRIPSEKGIVGAAAHSDQTIIVNDAANDPRFFGQVDESSGFITKALMAAPLRLGDRTLGVIEVINKRDGQPFDEDDDGMLVAFAGQAAIAIENARLFGQTDEALEARVHELSEMQRIVRELNAELDIDRVLSITLKYAKENTDADACNAAIVYEDSYRITAHEGYTDTQIDPWLVDNVSITGLIGRVIASKKPMLVEYVFIESDYDPIRHETAALLVVPIQREMKVLGLITLEGDTPEQFDWEMLDFVNRLSDNAAIAIANAQLVRKVQDANRAKSDLVGAVAHELKNPMTSIKGNTNLLTKGFAGALTDMQRELMMVIDRNINRMETLVQDLSEATRLETGQFSLNLTNVDFLEIIAESMTTIQVQIESKDQTLVQKIADDLPPVWGDHHRLTQILINLLSNANKYTPEGGTVELVIEPAENEWDPDGVAEVLHIAVADDGIGISEADQVKIFSRFFRAKDEATQDIPGTGLGLNIVKMLVELQGGQAWFESVHGEGSTFHFTVPLTRAMPTEEAEE